MEKLTNAKVSVIVPTIGRPDSLMDLLNSIALQTKKAYEIIVADASSGSEIHSVIANACWARAGLRVERIAVEEPNAVHQRRLAIAKATGEFLLLLDDDVVLERDCVEEMLKLFESNIEVVGVFADFNNQDWPVPARCWRLYLRYFHRIKAGEWQGRVFGPLLRYGYNPRPLHPMRVEWLGAGNSMILRGAYEKAGGFSGFFLHRCTMNEDVDLGLKLARIGTLLFCPSARMAHLHAPGGRLPVKVVAEDDIFNRYMILRKTREYGFLHALGLVFLFVVVETASGFVGSLRRLTFIGFGSRFHGRALGLIRAILYREGGA